MDKLRLSGLDLGKKKVPRLDGEFFSFLGVQTKIFLQDWLNAVHFYKGSIGLYSGDHVII